MNNRLSFFLPCAIAACLFLPTLFFDLTYFDDQVWIKDHQWFISNWNNLKSVFTQPDLVSQLFYRPALSVSFMLNAAISKASPWSYHLFNILVHAANVYILGAIFRALGYSARAAFWFSLIFAVHPALTQAVAWIPGRTDSLLATFALASFLFFLKFLERGRAPDQRWYLAFFVLALLTKETAIALPVVLVGYLFLIAPKQARKEKAKEAFLSLGFVVLAWFLLRQIVLIHSTSPSAATIIKSLWGNAPAILVYLGKSLVPTKLSVMPILKDSTLIYGITALAIVSGLLAVSKGWRRNYVAFGIAWFLFFLIPSLVISFLKHEYRLYLPIIGLLIVLMECGFVKKLEEGKGIAIILASLIVVLFAGLTLKYSFEFKDRFAFWENAVRTSPHSPLAHRNLGAMYYLVDKKEEAKALFEKALGLNPYEQMVHNNLGLIYADRNDLQRAEEEYRKEIAINPGYDNVYYNLGLLYAKERRLREAEGAWKKAIELNPKNLSAYKNLASLYLSVNDIQSANSVMAIMASMGIDVEKEFVAPWEKARREATGN